MTLEERPITRPVADRLHGFVVHRSESPANADEIDRLHKQVRAALIGCTASQLEDILRAINRIKDLSSDQGEVNG